MARSTGPLHSDSARGSAGALTHRVYRGTGTVSRHRSPSRVRLARQTILSPDEIPGCWSRYNAGQGYTLRIVGSLYYLASISDIHSGFGLLSAPSTGVQPAWFASDPAHGNRPYILPDGINDTINSVAFSPPITLPLDIWIVAADCGAPTVNRILMHLNTNLLNYLICWADPTKRWSFFTPSALNLAPYSDGTVKVWRITMTSTFIRLFWNGVPQSPPLAFANFNINWLRLLGYGGATAPYNRRLFEISFWRRILNSVEASLLLRFYTDTFNIV